MSKDSKKQGDSFGQQREESRRAYAEALCMRDRFPSVEQLVIDMEFADLQGTGRFSSQMRSFSASAKAFFAFPCPRTLCLHGGFDLDSVVAELLHGRRAASTGSLKCNGWVNPQRTENARCLLQMRYQLQASYEAPQTSSSNRRAGG